MHDLLGLQPGWKPRFVRRYAEMGKAAGEAFAAYAADVRAGTFPAAGETLRLSDDAAREPPSPQHAVVAPPPR